MKKTVSLFVCLLCLQASLFSQLNPETPTGLYVVSYNHSTLTSFFDAREDGVIVQKTFEDSEVNSALLKNLFTLRCNNCDLDELYTTLKEQSFVFLVEKIYPMELLYATPNDYSSATDRQWNLSSDHTNVENAWSILSPSDAKVKVSVIDAFGFDYDHSDICNNIEVLGNGNKALYAIDLNTFKYVENSTGTLSNGGVHPDFDFDNSDCGLTDISICDGTAANTHGNFVTHIIGAEADNSIGIAGVAHNKAEISFYTWDNPVQAIIHAKNRGVKVINMSFGNSSGSYGTANVFNEVATEAFNGGVTLVAAAGNHGIRAAGNCVYDGASSHYVFPAACNHVISVSGTKYDALTPSLNYYYIGHAHNGAVDIVAPSSNIVSNTVEACENQAGSIVPLYYFPSETGTSFAAPQISGIVAMMYSVNPVLNPKQIEYILKASANMSVYSQGDNAALLPDLKMGYGMVDAAAAVQMAKTFNPTDVVPYADLTDQNGFIYSSGNFTETSPILVGTAEGGLVSWKHNGNGYLTFPNGPSGKKAVYHPALQEKKHVRITMMVTGGSPQVEMEANYYMTFSSAYFCKNISGTYSFELDELNINPNIPEFTVYWTTIPNTPGTWSVVDGYKASFVADDPNAEFSVRISVSPYTSDGSLCSQVYNYQLINMISLPNDIAGQDRNCPGIIGYSSFMPLGYGVVDHRNACYTYSWSPTLGLDDPTSPNPFANPSVPTTYTLTVYDGNGQVVATDNVFVDASYDADNITITGAVVWDETSMIPIVKNNTPKRIRGEVVVKKGARLTIKNSTIEFGPDGKIYKPIADIGSIGTGIRVEAGGELIVDNSTLTTYDGCGNYFWSGIEIYSQHEHKGQAPTPDFDTQLSYQLNTVGKLTIRNSRIENATTGVYFGRKSLPFNPDVIWMANANAEIVNSYFVNNARSIYLTETMFEKGKSKVSILRNRFEVNENFFSGDDFYWADDFIRLYKNNLAEIRNNVFQDTSRTDSEILSLWSSNAVNGAFYTIGIKSFASSYSCTQNTFKHLKIAIDAYGIGAPSSMFIDHNTVDLCYSGIALQVANSAIVSNNTLRIFNPNGFNVIETPFGQTAYQSNDVFNNVVYPSYGVYAIASARALVENNTVYAEPNNVFGGNLSRGIVVHNSTNLGTTVKGNKMGNNFPLNPANNQFVGVGLETIGNNPALRFSCNRFVENDQALVLNRGLAGTLAHQSNTCAIVATNPAQAFFPENEFINPSGAPVEGHIYADQDLFTSTGAFFMYNDNAKAVTPADEDNPSPTAVSQILIDNVSYFNCKGATVPVQSYPEPTCGVIGVLRSAQTEEERILTEMQTTENALLLQQLENELIRLYMQEGKVQQAADYLENKNTVDAQKELIGLHLAYEHYEVAKQKLNALPIEGNEHYKQLMGLLINVEENHLPLDSLKSEDIALIEQLTGNNEPTTGTTDAAISAQGMLELIKGKQFNRWVLLPEQAMQRKSNNDESNTELKPINIEQQQNIDISLAPNPTNGKVDVYYMFNNTGEIVVYDVTGKQLLQQHIAAKSAINTLATENLVSGIYVVMVKDGEFTMRLKLVVNK